MKFFYDGDKILTVKTEILEGLAIIGSQVKESKQRVEDWISQV